MPDAGVWREMQSVLKAQFPSARITSTYREGARTAASNSVSYHALGKALDIAPDPRIFEWIRVTYPNSRELIYSPMGSQQIHNGASHVYTGRTRADHFDHIHWATNSLAEASNGGATFVPANNVTSGGGGSNPLIPDGIEQLAGFYQFISTPGIWLRIGIAIAGGVLLLIAFATMAGRGLI